ncbi:MAG: hypothetical protein V3V25_14235 [Paracoccaceae bacterium]
MDPRDKALLDHALLSERRKDSLYWLPRAVVPIAIVILVVLLFGPQPTKTYRTATVLKVESRPNKDLSNKFVTVSFNENTLVIKNRDRLIVPVVGKPVCVGIRTGAFVKITTYSLAFDQFCRK